MEDAAAGLLAATTAAEAEAEAEEEDVSMDGAVIGLTVGCICTRSSVLSVTDDPAFTDACTGDEFAVELVETKEQLVL